MSVFGAYSRYYDLLYKDKDYAGEADYVRALIARHHGTAATLLDLGCGTGRHAFLLAKTGLRVTGVDRSLDMLTSARAQLSKREGAVAFAHGDVRSVRLGQRFDVVTSLFHVMSYQTSNADLSAAFTTAREHLHPRGVFVFDAWYGPAVLHERPSERVRRLEDERTAVNRRAVPVSHPNDNVVDVNFEVEVRDKQSGEAETLRETHRMRYLFLPEVRFLLEACGFELREAYEFMTGRTLGFDTWSAVFVAGRTADFA